MAAAMAAQQQPGAWVLSKARLVVFGGSSTTFIVLAARQSGEQQAQAARVALPSAVGRCMRAKHANYACGCHCKAP